MRHDARAPGRSLPSPPPLPRGGTRPRGAGAGGLATAALLLLVPSLSAQSTLTEHTLSLDPGAEPPTASMDDVGWLTGRWTGEGLGAVAEEVWLPPVGGSMAGVFRLVREDGVDFYELVTLVEEEGTLALVLKHFGPDLVGWEEREETVRFPLVAREEGTLWFDGLTIRRTGADRMEIWVALVRAGETPREARFTYRRVAGSG